MRLAVFGANGSAGRALVRQALDGGHDVTAVTRHPGRFDLRHDRLEVVHADATDPASVAAVVKDKNAVLSLLGVPYTFWQVSLYSVTARQVIDAMRQQGVPRLVVVSSSRLSTDGLSTDGHSRDGFLRTRVLDPFLRRVVGRTAHDDMRLMEEAVRSSGLQWTIARPPALFDADAVGRYEASTSPLHGLFASRQDLAAVMLDAAVTDRFVGEVVYVVSRDGSPSLVKTLWNDAIEPHLARPQGS